MLIRRMASALSKRDICCGSCLDRKHWFGFSLSYLSSLGPFRTFYGLKFDAVSFRQAPISDILNCRIVNKDVRAISLPDKTIPFELVEPFDFANHSVSFQRDISTFSIHTRYAWKSTSEALVRWRRARETIVVLRRLNLRSKFKAFGLWTSLLRSKKGIPS